MDIKEYKDVGWWCAKIGLWPVRIMEDTIPILNEYVNELGVDMNSPQVVPYGFDYGCLKDKCAGTYNSFNSDKSPDITQDLLTLLDTENVLNSKTSIGKGIRDGIGLGMSKDHMIKFKMGSFTIAGIICSANDQEGWVRPKSIMLNCYDVLRANTNLVGEP